VEKLEVDIECPSCKREFRQRVEEMRPGNRRACPSCGAAIRFTGCDGHAAQQALDDFERKLKNLFR